MKVLYTELYDYYSKLNHVQNTIYVCTIFVAIHARSLLNIIRPVVHKEGECRTVHYLQMLFPKYNVQSCNVICNIVQTNVITCDHRTCTTLGAFLLSKLGHTKLITCFSDRPATNDDPGGGEKK